MTNKIFILLGRLAILSIVLLVIYAGIQQVYRTTADDPQITTVRELSHRLSQGYPLENHFLGDTVDMEKSESMFLLIYDEKQQPVKASGFLDGQIPSLPKGVFEYARQHGEDRITWSPRRGVRVAMVVEFAASAHPYFVAAGRSLQETELRVSSLSSMVLIAWGLAALITVFNWALSLRGKDSKTKVLD